MAEPKKIFIASSKAAMQLAKSLQSEMLRLNDQLVVEVWDVFPNGENFLDALIEKCRLCSFAIILFTQDDKVVGKDNVILAPRDNVIFELGLFIGGLGLNPRRCFVVSTVDEDAIPSDYRSRKVIRIDQDLDLNDQQACDRAVVAPADQIAKAIDKVPAHITLGVQVLSTSEMEDLERKHPLGVLKIDNNAIAVVINSSSPVESSDRRFAINVIENLRKNANYCYFMGTFDEYCNHAANLVYKIATATLGDPNSGEVSDEIISQNIEMVKQNLAAMKKHLNVHFLTDPRVDFCVHNTNYPDAAVCYLRHATTNTFLKWELGKEAQKWTADLNKLCPSCLKKNWAIGIFHSTNDIPIDLRHEGAKKKIVGERQDTLLRLISDNFPEGVRKALSTDLASSCFANETTNAA